MNTQPDNTDPIPSRLWTHRQDHAASLLSGNFADNVLRAARLERAENKDAHASRLWRFFHNPFALSALTAAACFVAAVIFHQQSTNATNEQNLADWRALAAQVDNLDPL